MEYGPYMCSLRYIIVQWKNGYLSWAIPVSISWSENKGGGRNLHRTIRRQSNGHIGCRFCIKHDGVCIRKSGSFSCGRNGISGKSDTWCIERIIDGDGYV